MADSCFLFRLVVSFLEDDVVLGTRAGSDGGSSWTTIVSITSSSPQTRSQGALFPLRTSRWAHFDNLFVCSLFTCKAPWLETIITHSFLSDKRCDGSKQATLLWAFLFRERGDQGLQDGQWWEGLYLNVFLLKMFYFWIDVWWYRHNMI